MPCVPGALYLAACGVRQQMVAGQKPPAAWVVERASTAVQPHFLVEGSPRAHQGHPGLWETHEVFDTDGFVFATDAGGREFTLEEVGRLCAQVPGAQTVFRGELYDFVRCRASPAVYQGSLGSHP